MDAKEMHYLTYDPDAMWQSMMLAYIEAGGDVLYPGDEKEMQLRGVQAILMQSFAGVDNALRMDTLRYAVREYLDEYGKKRNCYRIEAAAAKATIEITFRATGEGRVIPAGTALIAEDGEMTYALLEDITQTGYAQTIQTKVECQQAGSVGNGLLSGMQLQFLAVRDAIASVYCTESASGGQDEEDDETYRERIRRYGLANTTTGPQAQYESAARAVSSDILDARALNQGAGVVGVYLILEEDAVAETLISNVADALNAQNVRPLTDTVEVHTADAIPYVLNVQYAQESSSNISAAISAAVDEYTAWQDEKIGRAFNPDRLMASLYQAGATRVIWDAESSFNGGPIEYTEISAHAHCKGKISLAVIDG